MHRTILTSIALKSVLSLEKVICEDYKDKIDSNFCKDRKNGVFPFNDDSCSLYYSCFNGSEILYTLRKANEIAVCLNYEREF